MSDNALRSLLALFKIGVDTEELKKGEKEVEGFKEFLEKAGSAVKAFIGYEAIKEVGEFVEGTITAAAELKVMAERLGTGTDELQAMQLAAGEAGVSAHALTTGLRFLNRNIAEGGKHGAEAHAQFAKLGIALKDAHGKARPAGDVMADLADHIAEIPDTAKKTQLAMQLLGRGGAELIPLLNKGGEAFEEARRSMEELGGGMSEEFVESAHKAEAAGVRLNFAWTGLKSSIVNAILPGFEDMVRGITHLVGATIEFEKKSHVFEDAFKVGKIAFAVIGIYKIVSAVQALTKAQVLAFATNPIVLWLAAIAIATLVYNDLKTALEGGQSVFGDYFGETGIKQLSEDLKTAADIVDYLRFAFESLYHTVNSGISTVAGFLKSQSMTPEDLQAKLEGRTSQREADVNALYGEGKEEADKAAGGGGTLDALRARIAARHATTEPVGADARQAQIEDYQAKYRAQLPANGLGAAAGVSGPSMVQQNDVKIEQHFGAGTDPKAVKSAAQEGVEAGHARLKNNTNYNGSKP